jgi:hypothetical protein
MGDRFCAARLRRRPGTRLTVPDVGRVTYDVSVPPGYDPEDSGPALVALHPRPAFPTTAAPSCAKSSCRRSPIRMRCVSRLIVRLGPGPIRPRPSRHGGPRQIRQDFDRPPRGRSIQHGTGTWFMEAQHPDVFTAAVPIARPLATSRSTGWPWCRPSHSQPHRRGMPDQRLAHARQLEMLGRFASRR